MNPETSLEKLASQKEGGGWGEGGGKDRVYAFCGPPPFAASVL